MGAEFRIDGFAQILITGWAAPIFKRKRQDQKDNDQKGDTGVIITQSEDAPPA